MKYYIDEKKYHIMNLKYDQFLTHLYHQIVFLN